jgi:hypothetical protein
MDSTHARLGLYRLTVLSSTPRWKVTTIMIVRVGEGGMEMMTPWRTTRTRTRVVSFPTNFVKSSPNFSITNLGVKILTNCHDLLRNPLH